MTNIYDIVKEIKSFLRDSPIVNTVTFGDITQVDLNKTTIFPLTHFFLGNSTITSSTIQITVSMMFLDIVDYSKEFNSNDFGDREDNSNLLDVYNTQLQVANELVSSLKRGDLYAQGFQIVGDPICEPFKDKFENELAGWGVDITIEVYNSSPIC